MIPNKIPILCVYYYLLDDNFQGFHGNRSIICTTNHIVQISLYADFVKTQNLISTDMQVFLNQGTLVPMEINESTVNNRNFDLPGQLFLQFFVRFP